MTIGKTEWFKICSMTIGMGRMVWLLAVNALPAVLIMSGRAERKTWLWNETATVCYTIIPCTNGWIHVRFCLSPKPKAPNNLCKTKTTLH